MSLLLLGEMEEPPVCHVGHWRAGLSAAGLEHLLLGDPFPHPGGGQYRQRETGSHQGGTLPNAGERGLLWLQPISNVTCTQTLHSDILLPFSAPLFPFFPYSPHLSYYTNHVLSLQNFATFLVVHLLPAIFCNLPRFLGISPVFNIQNVDLPIELEALGRALCRMLGNKVW